MSAQPKPRIYLENTPTVERLVPALAVAIGLNESIMLLQIDFWIGQTDNFIDGKYWTYQSVRDMHTKAFPYWSIATINRTVASLQTQGLLHTANYNKRKGDKTRWFALNFEGLKKLGEKVPSISVIHGVFQNETPITQNETPSAQNETTLPEITTENTTEREIAPAAEKKDFDPRPPTEVRRTGDLPANMTLFLRNNAGDAYQQGLNKLVEIRLSPVFKAYAAGWADPVSAEPTPYEALNDWNVIETMQAAVDAGKYTLEDITKCTASKWANWKPGRGAMRIQYIAADIGSYINLRKQQQKPKVTPIQTGLPEHVKGIGSGDQFVRDIPNEEGKPNVA